MKLPSGMDSVAGWTGRRASPEARNVEVVLPLALWAWRPVVALWGPCVALDLIS